jgi:hypothetical protein
LDCAQVFAAGDERHVFAGLSKPAAKVATYAASAKNSYSHDRLVKRFYFFAPLRHCVKCFSRGILLHAKTQRREGAK